LTSAPYTFPRQTLPELITYPNKAAKLLGPERYTCPDNDFREFLKI
jgi:hypothetical protein